MSAVKYFYKAPSSDELFIALAESTAAVDALRKGDNSLPLIDVVSIYKVFTTRTGGLEGVLEEASKAQLENTFDSTNLDTAIRTILTKGECRHNAKVGGHTYNSTNDSHRGSV